MSCRILLDVTSAFGYLMTNLLICIIHVRLQSTKQTKHVTSVDHYIIFYEIEDYHKPVMTYISFGIYWLNFMGKPMPYSECLQFFNRLHKKS